jgi:hypothetical protein
MLYEQEKEFWDNLQKGIKPNPKNCDDVIKLFPKAIKDPIKANTEMIYVIQRLTELNKEIKNLDIIKDELFFQIKEFIGEHDGIQIDGQTAVTYKNTKDKVVKDWDKIEGEIVKLFPQAIDIIEKNTRSVCGSRRLLIK